MRAPEFRLRAPTPGLVGLPWDRPLEEWNVPEVPQLSREEGHDVDESTAARLWVIEVLTPYERLAHDAVHHTGTPIQAYYDLLEVRWLLSEQAGHDVGTNRSASVPGRRRHPTPRRRWRSPKCRPHSCRCWGDD